MGQRNGRGTTLAQIRKDKEEVAAYIKKHPDATTKKIAMELNMSERSVLYRKTSLGILPKPSRISLVQARIAESPCTDEEIARELKVSLKAVQEDLRRLKWMGEIVDEKLWRVRCQK
jgi:DNA-binding CsgD family transcriptional regulator